MTVFLVDPDVTLHHGDAVEVLAGLPDGSVDCVVTSPPFYGLRDYGVAGQIGLEATPDLWAARLVGVFREARRVLADHGTLWIECGDSYAGSGPSGASYQSETTKRREGQSQDGSFRLSKTLGERGLTYAEKKPIPPPGLKAKDLVGAPFLLAFALRADGWWWRSTNIWAKPNPLPESVRKRPTVSHSHVFQFAKCGKPHYWTHPFDHRLAADQPKPDYWWFDPERLRPPSHEPVGGWTRKNVWEGHDYFFDQEAVREPHSPDGRIKTVHDHLVEGSHDNHKGIGDGRERWPGAGRNLRSVWSIPPEPYPEAHFATWPTRLADLIVKAACPERVCRVCGKPRERIVEQAPNIHPGSSHDHSADLERGASSGQRRADGKPAGTIMRQRHQARGSPQTLGWSDCGHGDYRPGVVLDPFGGAGTTGVAARRHNRHAVLVDLNPGYLELAARRLQQLPLPLEAT